MNASSVSVSGLLSSARKQLQQQTRPAPAAGGRNGTEAVQRGAKRAAFGERKAKQEEQPQEFSIPKCASHAKLKPIVWLIHLVRFA